MATGTESAVGGRWSCLSGLLLPTSFSTRIAPTSRASSVVQQVSRHLPVVICLSLRVELEATFLQENLPGSTHRFADTLLTRELRLHALLVEKIEPETTKRSEQSVEGHHLSSHIYLVIAFRRIPTDDTGIRVHDHFQRRGNDHDEQEATESQHRSSGPFFLLMIPTPDAIPHPPNPIEIINAGIT
jgi:hypothetical protein